MNRSEILDGVLADFSPASVPTVPSRISRIPLFSRVAAGVFAVSFALAGVAVLQATPAAAACTIKPAAYSQVCSHGRTKWAYLYQSSYTEHGNYATRPKKCFRFLVTGWNPCATPTQYNQTICER